MRTSEVLDKAADLIERKGWCQDALRDDHGQCCLLGAIMYANEQLSCKERGTIHDLLRPLTGSSIAAWNNARERTKDEVISVMRAVACTERARECRMIETDADHVYVTVYA